MINKIYKKILQIIFKLKFTLYDSMEEYNNIKNEEANIKYSFAWYICIVLKIVMALFIIVLSLILFGCSAKTHIEYVPVSVPVVCDVDIPKKPIYSGDVVKDNLMIMLYADELRASLEKCK